jgi:DNA repair exonuclease SbcCD ATPase subunit
MATEPADGPEVSVTLPPPLDEWASERAESLGVDREELLVQLLSAYRAAADLDDDPTVGSTDLEESVEREVEAQLRERGDGEGTVGERIDALEKGFTKDLEALQNRVLQLRDAIRNRSKVDHDHGEFDRLSNRIDGIATDVADLSDEVAELEADVGDADEKLNTLANVVVQMQDDGVGQRSDREARLEHLRESANRRGVSEMSCDVCGEQVSVPLLTEPACPHCEAEFRDVTTSGRFFTKAVLTGPESSPAEPEKLPPAEEEPDE